MLTINNTVEGYLKDVEIKGNTWQDSENLADIRSVGTKVEGQELYEIPVLSCGKNLFKEFTQDNKSSSNYYDNNTRTYVSSTRVGIESFYTCINIDGQSALLNFNKEGSVEFAYKYTNNKPINFEEAYSSTCIVGTTYAPNNDGCAYLVITFRTLTEGAVGKLKDIMVIEGTQSTPYESYQEDKLTILSPTPLEKVGNVADRIICKDGVWGVEKNIKTKIIDGSDSTMLVDTGGCTENTLFLKGYSNDAKLKQLCISNYPAFSNMWSFYKKDVEGVAIGETDAGYGGNCYCVTISKSKASDLSGARNYLKNNPVLVKYQLTQPTFIPLPHDQQIALRTFAGRTHISFDTEIEPILKAQVPKSLGATVNTHTTQIDNLNKELDRVKKLEESTVSTVTSNKAFTTIAETSGGYLEDVKIEGKTLVNLATTSKITITDTSNKIISRKGFKKGEVYTLAIFTKNKNTTSKIYLGYTSAIGYSPNSLMDLSVTDYCVDKFRMATDENTWGIGGYAGFEGSVDIELVLLEGDHTDKDITFFEGLKSVGQDTDEISVSSVDSNGNLANNVKYTGGYYQSNNGFVAHSNWVQSDYIRVYDTNTTYTFDIAPFMGNNTVVMCDSNKKPLKVAPRVGNTFTITDINCKYVVLLGRKNPETAFTTEELQSINTMLFKGDYIKPNIPHQSNKKQILYYNPNTQTWEKPVLCEWDSIEKHSDGKYYYHKRSEEVVLNGSEDWDSINIKEGYIWAYSSRVLPAYSKHQGNYIFNTCISDRLNTYYGYGHISDEYFGNSVALNERYLKISLSDSILPSVDKEGIAKWLQANPVTVVYQLAQEEVYECTNLDLITYSGETNLIVNSGVIQPKLELKVHSNISNIVKLLQEKVSVLENNTSSYIVTQNRLQLASTYAADSVTFKVDYASAFDNRSVDGYNPDLYNLILSNILVGKDNYDYDKMFSIILDYASWDQISWEQFDELVLLMDIQHNPPIEIPEEDYTEEEIPEI